MLKKSASGVLTSLRGSTDGQEYASASSLAAALLDSLFDHPAGTPYASSIPAMGVHTDRSKLFSRSLLGYLSTCIFGSVGQKGIGHKQLFARCSLLTSQIHQLSRLFFCQTILFLA
jgi:hypothetical protein